MVVRHAMLQPHPAPSTSATMGRSPGDLRPFRRRTRGSKPRPNPPFASKSSCAGVSSSSGRTRPVSAAASGVEAKPSTTERTHPGAASTSSSKKARTSPFAAHNARLRAKSRPVRGSRTYSACGKISRTKASVAFWVPLSTTRISSGGYSCIARDRSARARSSGRSRVQMATLTVGSAVSANAAWSRSSSF